jgi:hypothetical protein
MLLLGILLVLLTLAVAIAISIKANQAVRNSTNGITRVLSAPSRRHKRTSSRGERRRTPW